MTMTTIEEGIANWAKMQKMAAEAEAKDSTLAKRARRYEHGLAKRQRRIFNSDKPL